MSNNSWIQNIMDGERCIQARGNPVSALRNVISSGICDILQVDVSNDRIHIPAKGAEASWSGLIRASNVELCAEKLDEKRDCFPEVFGIQSIARVTSRNGWILFQLSPDYYDRAVRMTAAEHTELKEPETYCSYRLRMLERYESAGCPDEPEIHRALLLSWHAAETGRETDCRRAEEALLRMTRCRAPRDRQNLRRLCGDVARSARRALYRKTGDY